MKPPRSGAPLTVRGAADVERVAAWAARAGITVADEATLVGLTLSDDRWIVDFVVHPAVV